MSALKKSSVTPPVRALGVIAGGGGLPAQLIKACEEQGIEIFIVAFDGQTDPAILKDRKYMLTRMGAAGLIINTLKSHNISDLVFIGAIRRPSLKEMRPDLRTLKFFTRLATRAIGDDGLLKAMKKELEQEGFRLHAVQRFVPSLLASIGPVGQYSPARSQNDEIERGLQILVELGRLDIGQGVVVQDGIVLGVEAIEGTDQLLLRCGGLKRAGRGPVFLKSSKPGQADDLDLPTVGPDTVINAGEQGFSGIVVEAGRTLMFEPDKVAELADHYKMFVTGVDLPQLPGKGK